MNIDRIATYIEINNIREYAVLHKSGEYDCLGINKNIKSLFNKAITNINHRHHDVRHTLNNSEDILYFDGVCFLKERIYPNGDVYYKLDNIMLQQIRNDIIDNILL